MTITELIYSDKGTISPAEAADALGCDPRTVSRAIAAGTVPAVPMGRRKFIPIAPFLELFGLTWQGGNRVE
jgi:excisionase family DNA binding protein